MQGTRLRGSWGISSVDESTFTFMIEDPNLPPWVPEPPSLAVQDEEYDPTRQSLRTFTGLIAPRNADQVVASAKAATTYPPGLCLQWSRKQALIPSMWPSAAVAWQNTVRKHFDRNFPPGAFVFWTGGSEGNGHIAISLGNGFVRSTDAGGSGIIATRHVSWFDRAWPSQNYAGWTDNVNGYTVLGVEEDEMQPEDFERIREIVVNNTPSAAAIRTIVEEEVDKRIDQMWTETIDVVDPNSAERKNLTYRQLLRQVWQKVSRHVAS